ncbi:MAG: HAD-IB family phosphatase [Prevotella sp.]|nr:HAD-IB family phosphatase [Prevotella sp.]
MKNDIGAGQHTHPQSRKAPSRADALVRPNDANGSLPDDSTSSPPLSSSINVYDFDGTLTSKDSLLAFLQFAKGKWYTYLLLLCYSPILVMMKMGLYPNGKAKERIFSHCFKGMLERDFDALCKRFAESHSSILKTDMLKDVAQALDEGRGVIVVTASIRNWVAPLLEPFFDIAQTMKGHGIMVVGTEIEVADRHLTGRFSTPNCHGQEKVDRLQAIIPNRHDYHIVGYGDSQGDKEMLAWVDEGHLITNESSFNEAIRFGIVGVLAVAIQYLIYLLVVRITSPGIANTVAYLVSFTFNFFASTYFTFRVKANARRGAGFALSHVINYLLQMGSLHLFLWMGISKEWAPLPMFCVCVPVNFLLVRFFLKR